MAKKTMDDLARLMAAGFRTMRDEMHQHRVAVGQVREAVIAYSGKEQQHDAAKGTRIDKLEADMLELKRKAAM